jgi:hypothetical protein
VTFPGGYLYDVALSRDGKWLAAGGRPPLARDPAKGNDVLKLWDLSGAEPRELPLSHSEKREPHALAFSPDGKTLAATGVGQFLTLWDLSTSPPREQVLLKIRNDITSRGLAFSPDGKTLAVSDGRSLDGRNWSELALWDVSRRPVPDPKLIFLEQPPTGRQSSRRNVMQTLAYSADGKYLAGSNDNLIVLWDATGKQVWESTSRSGAHNKLAFAPDGRHVAVANVYGFVAVFRLDPAAPHGSEPGGRGAGGSRPGPRNGPSAEEIIDRAIEAAGGAEAIGKFGAVTYKVRGTLEGDPCTGEEAIQWPNKRRSSYEITRKGGKVTMVIVGDGRTHWEKTNGTLRELDPAESLDLRKGLFHEYLTTLLPIRDRKLGLTAEPPITVDRRPAVGVRVTISSDLADPPPLRLHFDAESHLLVRYEGFPNVQVGRSGRTYRSEHFYRDYKDVQGVKVPTRLVVRHNGKVAADWELFDIRLEPKLGDDLFAKP